ncbi:bifunctional DNA primase/polymerase [Streptomyces sp. G-G2]|uniref:bifunctional DNA primase/polymerase n=1 Tax=Streptomyces sp. G-G2 TaxID=3046201 RepID=UPI0024B99411|nr:bifunctional DNA primase/polymerase [Streptomyces sp. G-G2]MDJ0383990.1 bifunctional DNA primase/polymerase [Streptomyces sp. G-G2]
MREILGRRLQRLRSSLQSLQPLQALQSLHPLRFAQRRAGIKPGAAPALPQPLDAALTCATAWEWPVLPGVGRAGADSARCACPDPDCVVPGAHPFDPGLLAATTDPRMVSWWWANRPAAPLLLATGGAAPCAVSLPATAAARALVRLDQRGMRLGPVVATPTRWSLLVAPYSLERLGELLYAKDHVPSSLRFHGEGGYLLLPPSAASGGGQVRWEREPSAAAGRPWLPEIEAVVDALVEASSGAPGGGSRLAY